MRRTLIVGTRGSPLARAQAERVASRIRTRWPEMECAIRVFRTRGDREGEQPLPEIGGKGLFTEELEAALRNGEIDFAVHSLKDLPTTLEDGLTLGAIPEREDPRDIWCVRDGAAPRHPREASPGFRIGTSSLRRRAQCLALQPEAEVVPIRGNVETRLAKLTSGKYDAIILAAAGLVRLGIATPGHAIALEPPEWLPAPGQGALAVECRAHDGPILALLGALEDPTARWEAEAERALLSALEGGCEVPLGALARIDGSRLQLWAFVATPDGRRLVRGHAEGPAREAPAIGRRLAADLRARGGEDILRSLRASSDV